MHIRPERDEDISAIRAVTVAAFGGRHQEARLVDLIRQSEHFVPELSLVAVEDGDVVGHILFSHVFLRNGGRDRVLSLAPLSVHPDHQGKGVGAALMHAGIEAVRRHGEPIVVVEGHPAYYPRFGFESASAAGIEPPSPDIPDGAWMVLFVDASARGITGSVEYPPAFHETGAIGP